MTASASSVSDGGLVIERRRPAEPRPLPFTVFGEEPDTAEAAESLAHDLLYVGAKHLVVSLPKVGKSVFALHLASALVRHEPFLGLATEPTTVLYLTEEPFSSFRLKLAKLGIEHDPHFRYLRRSHPDVFGRPWPEVVRLTHAVALEANAGLVVVDVLHRWTGWREGQANDPGAVAHALGVLDPLTEDGIASLVLHHSTWEGRSRGSTDIPGAVDMVYTITGEAGTSGPRALVWGGGRFDPPAESLAYRLEDGVLVSQGSQSLRSASKTAAVVDAVKLLGDGRTTAEVAEELGWSVRTTFNYLDRARKHQLLGADEGPRTQLLWRRRRPREYLEDLSDDGS